jgi:hypothetical protein
MGNGRRIVPHVKMIIKTLEKKLNRKKMRRKRKTVLLLCMFIFVAGQAQIAKTVNITNPGNLYSTLTSSELIATSDLTITGSINAADFKTMRDNMPLLTNIDLSGVKIESYTGIINKVVETFNANEIPKNAFCDMTTTITKSKTNLISIILPTSVIAINDFAFYSCTGLTSVAISSSTISIRDYAFCGCSGLKTINIPTSVTSIGVGSFADCTGLLSIVIPSSITSISKNAFSGCASASSITIPTSVNIIGDFAFSACLKLNSLIIPSSVTTIGSQAFAICSNLTSIFIPATVTYIGDKAFTSCGGKITVENGNEYFSAVDEVLFNKTQTILITCLISKKGSYDIPSTVTTISNAAFSSCIELTSVKIPSTVTSIGEGAFQECQGLVSINIPTSITKLEPYTFYHCINVNSIVIPSSLTTIGKYSFAYCNRLTSINLPSQISLIDKYAFSGCTALTSIYANATTPIDLSLSIKVFNNVSIVNCILYVPVGSLNLYKVANQWKDFTNIEEMTTGIVPVSISDIKIKTDNGNLIVENAKAGEKVEIYSITGLKIKEQLIKCFQTKIKLQRGIYLIRIENYSDKVSIK